MSQDSHSHSGAHYTTNWPAVIGVALLVPVAVSGPIVSLLFSPTSSESPRPVVRDVPEPVEIAASTRLPFQGPPATAPLPALDSDPFVSSESRVAAKQTPSSISDRPAIAVPAAPREAILGKPLDATLAAVTKAAPAQRTPESAAASPQLSAGQPSAAQPGELDDLPSPYEYELQDELARFATTIDLRAGDAASISRLCGHDDAGSSLAALKQLVDQRPDLEGLPFEDAGQCRLDPSAAKKLNSISTEVQTILGMRNLARQDSLSSASSESESFAYLMETKADWRTVEAVPGLVQTMQVQESYDRAALVDVLAYVPDRTTSVVLAQRALFDLSAAVRDEAVAALAKRPLDEFQETLVKGLRYPWTRVAEHAAHTLVKLDANEVVPDLVDLLDAPNPNAPYRKENQWVVDELVRVNHLRNCVLCHAPSTSRTDLVRGFVPTPGQPLPKSYRPSRSSRGPFVRADTTYLRQDFSVMHLLEDQKPWPDVQRFDYFVRTRRATTDEIRDRAARAEPSREAEPDPHRQAVLFALRKLTGVDLGDRSDAWRQHF